MHWFHIVGPMNLGAKVNSDGPVSNVWIVALLSRIRNEINCQVNISCTNLLNFCIKWLDSS